MSPILRRSGILLHPSSLPGPYGSGDLGAAAYHFVDWLCTARQRLWQILPLGGVGPGNSPYMSPSAFAGNELFIDLDALCRAGWLDASELAATPPFDERRIDYGQVRTFRQQALRRAAQRFFAQTATATPDFAEFMTFCQQHEWLDDYALFMALDGHYGGDGRVWQDWPQALVTREKKALQEATQRFADECRFWKFCQWCFDRQWTALKHYANERDIEIIGDVPVFVSPHSADVWAHQELFDLNEDGTLRVVAGVPPDYFSATGQHWGNPLYRWKAHQQDHYRWWIKRMQHILQHCDIVRIDHFRGFESYWEIPAECTTAIDGQWQKGPGYDFFKQLFAALNYANTGAIGAARIIAEDLGIITDKVIALREKCGLPGMRILQFAFDGHLDNFYLPHNFEANTVVYTGTHDNDTCCGWWHKLATHEQDFVRRYLGIRGDTIHWDLIRAASASVAAMSIIPLQDVLGLDSTHRMNSPSQAEGAWEWRFSWQQVAPWHATFLADLAEVHGRTMTFGNNAS